MTILRFTPTQAQEALDRHLMEMNCTLQELADYGRLGMFPSERHRVIHALAQDLGLTEQTNTL